jgi:hypothetical protein
VWEAIMTGTRWRVANLGVAFVVELVALAVLGCWGAHTGATLPTSVALGVGLPLAAAVLWGLFAAPRATVRIPALAWATKCLVFGVATLALCQLGRPLLALVFATVLIANLAVLNLAPRTRS